ncbi:MAG: glycerol-3-phosphate dehydrogenase, partial [Microcystis panniformis]
MLENAKKITVIGGGIWGQTLANLARRNHLTVRVWSRHSVEDLGAIIADTDVIISAVSIKGVAPMIEKLEQLPLNSPTIIVTATKGLDPITTRTPFHLWNQAFPANPLVVLSGP